MGKYFLSKKIFLNTIIIKFKYLGGAKNYIFRGFLPN